MIRQPRLAATSSPASGAIWAEKRSITIRSSRRYGLDYECGMRNAECGMSGQASMTDAYICAALRTPVGKHGGSLAAQMYASVIDARSEEHTSELQSLAYL